MNRVPPTEKLSIDVATHMLILRDEVEVDENTTKVFWKVHPAGNRRMRRAGLSRHHPYYTKSRHRGREWARMRDVFATVQEEHNHDHVE